MVDAQRRVCCKWMDVWTRAHKLGKTVSENLLAVLWDAKVIFLLLFHGCEYVANELKADAFLIQTGYSLR